MSKNSLQKSFNGLKLQLYISATAAVKIKLCPVRHALPLSLGSVNIPQVTSHLCLKPLPGVHIEKRVSINCPLVVKLNLYQAQLDINLLNLMCSYPK